MKLDDFPIFKAALIEAGKRHAIEAAAYRARTPNKKFQPFDENREFVAVSKALEIAGDAIEDGQILNPRYLEVKDTLNRAIGNAYDTVFKKPYLALDHGDQRRDALSDIYYGTPSLHTMVGFAKKVNAAFKKNNDPILRDTIKLLLEIVPLANAINGLKDKIVKRKVLTPQEREEANRKEKYTPPPSNANSVALVRDMLNKFVAESYAQLVEYYVNRYNSYLKGYLKAVDQVADGSYKGNEARRFPYSVKTFSPYEYYRMPGGRIDSRSAQIVDKLVTNDNTPDGRAVKRMDADAIIHKLATAVADDIKEVYVVKNLKKLTSILEAKGDDNFLSVDEINGKTNMSYLSGEMLVKFKDGSSFQAANSVVFVVNEYGTAFERFPLTFHNVKMPDGSKMGSPSEERMNTVFVGKTA